MKNFNITIFLLLSLSFLSIDLQAQSKTKYQAWVTFNNDLPTIKGYIYELKDSSITLSQFDKKTFLKYEAEVDVKWIKDIKIRKKKGIRKGILTGALAGLVVGFSLGLFTPGCSSTDYFCITPIETGAMITMVSVPIGTIIGGFIGAKKEKYKVNGQHSNYQLDKKKLKKCAILN